MNSVFNILANVYHGVEFEAALRKEIHHMKIITRKDNNNNNNSYSGNKKKYFF